MVVVVASGILTAAHVNLIVGALLRFLTHYVSFALLGHNLVDETLLALEVVAHFLRFVRSASVLEHRQAGFHAGAVGHTACKDRTAIHVHGDDLGCQFYLLIIHLALAIQVHKAPFGKHDGVIGLINNRSIERFLLLAAHRIERHGIGCQRIHPDAIIHSPTTISHTLGIRVHTKHETGCQDDERDNSM